MKHSLSALMVMVAAAMAPPLRSRHSPEPFLTEPTSNPAGRRNGPGWSNRHVQRMAAKARNVKRHRAALRGRK